MLGTTNQTFNGDVLRSSPVRAIRFEMAMMAAAADDAGAVGGEPDRVYSPSWIGIKGWVSTSSANWPDFMHDRSSAGGSTPTMSVDAIRSDRKSVV